MICIWFSPADATATTSSLAPVKSRMIHLSGAGLPRLSWKKANKQMYGSSILVLVFRFHCKKSYPAKSSPLTSVDVLESIDGKNAEWVTTISYSSAIFRGIKAA